jgi:uncharacterized protein YxeA
MKDIVSLVSAAALLTAGGIGLYMYKSQDTDSDNENELNNKEQDNYETQNEENILSEITPKYKDTTNKNNRQKTKRNKKSLHSKRSNTYKYNK